MFDLDYLKTLPLEPLCIEDRFYPLGCCEANHGIAPLRVSLGVKMVGHHFLGRGCEWSNRARRRIGFS